MFMSDRLDETVHINVRLQELQKLINDANHIIFFGGAGVSTESGIPDFRSKDGLYNQHDVQFDKYQPEYLLSNECLNHNPKVFYEFYRQKLDCRNIEPNITHKKLVELEESGKRISIITQNIDGLHEKAGSKEIYNIHGTTLKNYCNKCHKEYPSDYIFNSSDLIPRCACSQNSFIRPDVTLYGEMLPEAFQNAIDIVSKGDLMIVAGTSLTVYPAASITNYFDGPLVIINRDPTEQDQFANIVFRESLGEVFNKL